MSEYATNGAILLCTGGTAPGKLQVTSNILLSVQGNQVATISDKAPLANIQPFGACSLKPFSPPCVPAPTMWTGFLNSVKIPGGNPLLKTSTIQCACGGMIRFQNSGQLKGEKVVINPTSPQIQALKKAALNSVPFCEECEKLKEQKKQIRAVDVYWMEEGSEERHYDVFPEKPVTVYIESVDYEPGEALTLHIKDSEGRMFKGGEKFMTISGNVDADGVLCVPNFLAEYEEQQN